MKRPQRKRKQTQEQFETELKALWKQLHDARAEYGAVETQAAYDISAAQDRLAVIERHMEDFLSKGMFIKRRKRAK